MPYGVPDALWAMLPPDDQAAVIASSQGQPPPQIGGYDPAPPTFTQPPPIPFPGTPPPLVQTPDGIGYEWTGSFYQAFPDSATFLATGHTWADFVQVPYPPGPVGPALVSVNEPQGDATGNGGDDLELFALVGEDRVSPPGVEPQLPAQAWAAFRDYLLPSKTTRPNLPERRQSIESHGRRLHRVVASDLWRPRT